MVNFNLALRHHLDFETRSEADLTEVGAWAYALHPSTQITAITFGPSRERLETFLGHDRGYDWGTFKPFADIDKLIIGAHSAHFEYAIYSLILHRKFGWPARWAPSLWRCTLAKAAACGLPLGLDPLGRILQVKTPKDLEGRGVMLQLAKPLYIDPLFGATYDETPAKHARLGAYNRVDVCSEIEVDEIVPDLTPDEQKVFEMDLEINRRGVTIDLEFARRGAALAAPLVERLNTRLHRITCTVDRCTVRTCNGVDKATRLAAMQRYLAERHGINVSSLDKESVTVLLEDPSLNAVAREVLTIRRQVAKKNSVAKFAAALACTSPDGRARGLLQYHGAHTGRFSGRLLQPHNMPKGFKAKEQAEALAAIMSSDVDGFVARYGAKSMDALSDSLRALFVAAPGKQLVCADFNAIEARVLFWLAGEDDALTAYRRGESPYLDMARTIYPKAGLPATAEEAKKTHPDEYDIGKRTILGCGYQMGWKRFKGNIFAETAKVGKPIRIPDDLAQRAVKFYRQKYAHVKALWYDTERAAMNAVRDPGKVYSCGTMGRVGFSMSMDRRFLVCRLPSGRYLRYWKPEVIDAWITFCDDETCPHWVSDDEAMCPKRQRRTQLCFTGEDETTKQFVPLATYGGALVENVVQAIARDLMVNGMFKVQAVGFDVLLTVHDEVLCEAVAPDLKKFIAVMCDVPIWASGCPVAAEGWTGGRYHK